MGIKTTSSVDVGDFVYAKTSKNKIYVVLVEGYSPYAEDSSYILKDVVTNKRFICEASLVIKIENEKRLSIIRLLYTE